jgi:hypothetical protein
MIIHQLVGVLEGSQLSRLILEKYARSASLASLRRTLANKKG